MWLQHRNPWMSATKENSYFINNTENLTLCSVSDFCTQKQEVYKYTERKHNPNFPNWDLRKLCIQYGQPVRGLHELSILDVDVDLEDLRVQTFASMPASYTRSTMLTQILILILIPTSTSGPLNFCFKIIYNRLLSGCCYNECRVFFYQTCACIVQQRPRWAVVQRIARNLPPS